MITKIELKEMLNIYDVSIIRIDLINKNVSILKNDNIIKNKNLNISVEKITDIIKKYTTYWENEYKNQSIIDGNSCELNIYTDEEIIKYCFKNKYPSNYNEFIEILKKEIDVL